MKKLSTINYLSVIVILLTINSCLNKAEEPKNNLLFYDNLRAKENILKKYENDEDLNPENYVKIWALSIYEPAEFILIKEDGNSWRMIKYLYTLRDTIIEKEVLYLYPSPYKTKVSENISYVESLCKSDIQLNKELSISYFQLLDKELKNNFDKEAELKNIRHQLDGKTLIVEIQLDSKYSYYFTSSDTSLFYYKLKDSLLNLSNDSDLFFLLDYSFLKLH